MTRRGDHLNLSDEHNARGIDLADRGWLDEAISEFEKAIDLDPESAHARDNLGTVLAEKGQLLEALFEYVDAVRAEPESPSAHHYLASFLASQGHELAVAEHRRTIELEYEFPDAHLNLALAMAERGQLEDAVAELETAHAQMPDDELIHHELACCLIDVERYPEAIGHLKKIIKLYPEHIEAYVDLGIAYTAQGFYAEAETILKSALEIDTYDFAAQYHLAALYATWGRVDNALDQLELAATRDHEKVRHWIKNDRLFDGLRNEARYQRLMT